MNNKKEKKIIRDIGEWTLCLSLAFVIAVFIRSNAFAITSVDGSSMESTFHDREKVIDYKLSYYSKEPQRGDVIIIDVYNDSKESILDKMVKNSKEIVDVLSGIKDERYYIKRVIGIPGDEVDIKDGYVYINGEKQEEKYVKGKTYANEVSLPTVVPENTVFVLGDNREVSVDSREIGFINYNQIEGKVIYKIWPLNKIGSTNTDN